MAAGSYQLIWVAQGGGSGSVTLSSLPQTGATTGQAIVWNGSSWAPGTVSGSGGGTLNSLSADVTTGTADGNGNAVATVAYVGGKAASTVANAVTTVGTASASNTASSLVMRDSSGNFSASTISAALNGNATSATTAASATSYTGAVTLSQLAQTSATSGQAIVWNGTAWAPATVSGGGGGGSGTVTSVALSDASSTPIYTVSGSPVTTSGTLTLTLASQSSGLVFAVGTSSGGQPTFQNLALGHLPSATAQKVLRSPGTTGQAAGAPVWGNVFAADIRTPTDTTGYVLTVTGTVTAPTFQAPTVAAANITGSIALSQLAQTSATSNQVIAWNGTSWAPATPTSGGITALTGDVTASGSGSQAATVAQVGGKTASAVASAVTTVAAASSGVSTSNLVMRDSSGNFSAGTITAALSGNATTATTATTATNYTGAVALSQLAQTSATTGQAVVWNGSAWAPATVSGGGGSSAPNIVASTTTPSASDTGKIFIATTATTATLPTSPATNTQYTYINGSGGTQTIAQGSSTQIYVGNTASTSGTGGNIVLNGQGTSVTLVCQASSNTWYATSDAGQITVT